MHANAAADVPARLEALGASPGSPGPRSGVQAAAALDLVVHLRRPGAARRVTQIAVVSRGGSDLELLPALTDGDPAGERGPGWPLLAARLGR